jgi:carbamoyltransferase
LKFKRSLHRGCLDWAPELKTEQDMFDIAATTQKLYELSFGILLEKAKKLVNSNNLVLIGGCALNCAANPIAFRYFKNIWILPAPGDAGSSVGAVLSGTNKHIDWPGPYLGYDIGRIKENEEIVTYLQEKKICGLARGRAEFGPRALGNRSLLADPRGKAIKDEVNAIKHREQFRPFAPAILEEHADKYFEMPVNKSPYMQYVAKCKKPNEVPAIVHYDGTSRVQTVNKDDNPEFRKLLEIWYERTGCPMLLNTSLNIKGEPIVNDEKDVRNWVERYNFPIWT